MNMKMYNPYRNEEMNMDNVGGIKVESGEKREFSTGAKKQPATGKGTPALFPPDAYLEISKHFEDGAVVHGDRNWEKGIPLSELINSLERHIAQEKMGLTDERHDRAIAWCAIAYLATKMRIKADILPAELDDLCGVYGKSKIVDIVKIYKINETENGWWVMEYSTGQYLRKDLKFHSTCCSEGFFKTKELAEETLQAYLDKMENKS